ncbi:MAG: pentapeptide repeat-containing protein [Spirochaetales bacterium]|nr:pentapeptide repeat-containing protein [Spirochaetales bacterium]
MPVYGAQGKAILMEHLSSGKPLDNVQLNNIELQDFELENRTLKELSCQRSILDNSHFVKCNVYDSVFEESNLKNGTFQFASFNNVNYNSSILLRAQFLDSYLLNGAFKRCYMQRTRFVGCSLKEILFMNVEASRSQFQQSVFSGCDFLFDDSGGITGLQESTFTDSLFIDCSFQGFALTGVNMKNCSFIRCAFGLPDWEDVEIQGNCFVLCSGLPAWKNAPFVEPMVLEKEIEAARFLSELRGDE